MVVISAPSACTARTEQLFTLSPSSSTVQEPQFEVSQPMGVPTRPEPVAQVVREQQARLHLVLVDDPVDLHPNSCHGPSRTASRRWRRAGRVTWLTWQRT